MSPARDNMVTFYIDTVEIKRNGKCYTDPNK